MTNVNHFMNRFPNLQLNSPNSSIANVKIEVGTASVKKYTPEAFVRVQSRNGFVSRMKKSLKNISLTSNASHTSVSQWILHWNTACREILLAWLLNEISRIKSPLLSIYFIHIECDTYFPKIYTKDALGRDRVGGTPREVFSFSFVPFLFFFLPAPLLKGSVENRLLASVCYDFGKAAFEQCPFSPDLKNVQTKSYLRTSMETFLQSFPNFDLTNPNSPLLRQKVSVGAGTSYTPLAFMRRAARNGFAHTARMSSKREERAKPRMPDYIPESDDSDMAPILFPCVEWGTGANDNLWTVLTIPSTLSTDTCLVKVIFFCCAFEIY